MGAVKEDEEEERGGVLPSAGAGEGVRVLPGCKEQRRSFTQQLGLVAFQHLEAALTLRGAPSELTQNLQTAGF